MVLAFDNAGDFAKAVYGDASQQQAGTNNVIASTNPSSSMKGGKNNSKNNSKKNDKKNDKKNNKKRGGKNNSKKNNSKKQRGGK